MEEIQGDDCFRKLDLEQYVIFYFTASWCAPCQRIAPEIVNLSNELDETKIKFFKIDIDQEDFFDSIASLKSEGFYGLNITMPLKYLAFQICDEVTERSSLCKSVNTITFSDKKI